MKKYTFWFLTSLIFIFSAGCTWKNSQDIQQEQSSNINAVLNMNENNNGVQEKSYNSSTYKLSFSYDPNCVVTEDQWGVQIACADEEITIIRQADIPRRPLMPHLIETIQVSGVSAQLYHDQDQKTGNDQDIVIFDIPNSQDDLYIAGKGKVFTQIVSSLKVS